LKSLSRRIKKNQKTLPVDAIDPGDRDDLKEGDHHKREVSGEVVEQVHQVLSILHPERESKKEGESAEQS
jgi:hypothetical protein